MTDEETTEVEGPKTVTREDAHGREVEVEVGVDGENPVTPNNPPEGAVGAVSPDVYSASGQPSEGSFGDGQDLRKAAQGDPGQPDDDNRAEDYEPAEESEEDDGDGDGDGDDEEPKEES